MDILSMIRVVADVLRNRGIVLDLEEMLELLGDICRVSRRPLPFSCYPLGFRKSSFV